MKSMTKPGSVDRLLTSTEPLDQRRAAQCVRDVYAFCKLPSPQIIFVGGPTELKRLFDPADEGLRTEDYNDIAHFGGSRSYTSSMRLSSVVGGLFWDVRPEGDSWRKQILSMPSWKLYQGEYPYDRVITPMWDECYVLLTLKDKCFVVDRPRVALTNDRGFHSADGPAIVFRDGTEVYCYEGLLVDEKHIRRPGELTLADVHQHNSRKHFLIDRMGVERYLDLVARWSPPKSDMDKFFSFHKMQCSEDEGRPKWNKEGCGWMYDKRPYVVNFGSGSFNGTSGSLWRVENYRDNYHFVGHPFDSEHHALLFNPEDREFWDALDVREMTFRGILDFEVGFQNNKFWVKTKDRGGMNRCRHDCVPSWFKARMFRNQDALYDAGNYQAKFEGGKLSFAGVKVNTSGCIERDEPFCLHAGLFGGNESVPIYYFDFDVEADTWPGLLDAWARKAFDWLAMHEDSSRMP